ncbi:MAG: sigma-70 family RNA polymerase sigma factor, partial [Oscillospiraceae bacterium]|nr:sigma-70 family RNA polymerase sigma factor [Oscillospiraceae bacterium]
SNLKYVKEIAYNFKLDSLSSMDRDDLISIGIIGLIDAVMTYDETKSMKFKNYAMLKIKGAMIDELRKNSLIPGYKYKLIKEYLNCLDDLKKGKAQDLTKLNIAKRMNLSVKEIEKIESNLSFINMISIEEIIESENFEIKSNELTPEEHYFKKRELSFLSKSLESLTKKEKEVLYLYYFKGLSLKEIGIRMDLTEGRISQINKKMLNNLRKLYEENYDSN